MRRHPDVRWLRRATDIPALAATQARLLDLYRAYLQTDLLMSALLFSCALGIACFWAVGFIGHRLTRNWHEE